MVVKSSLKAIPQNHNKTKKIPRATISGCLHFYTGFLGVTVNTQAYLHEQHFIFIWYISSGKVLIMAEASSLTEFFLHRIVTYKLLKQNCKTNLCGNACATENIVSKFTLFVKISLIGCINLHGSKQKYHCFLLKARG